MITINHHPTVQRILDDWKTSLSKPRPTTPVQCTADDLRQLIRTLEESLDSVTEQLDDLHKVPFKQLLLVNARWIKQRLVQLCTTNRHE